MVARGDGGSTDGGTNGDCFCVGVSMMNESGDDFVESLGGVNARRAHCYVRAGWWAVPAAAYIGRMPPPPRPPPAPPPPSPSPRGRGRIVRRAVVLQRKCGTGRTRCHMIWISSSFVRVLCTSVFFLCFMCNFSAVTLVKKSRGRVYVLRTVCQCQTCLL